MFCQGALEVQWKECRCHLLWGQCGCRILERCNTIVLLIYDDYRAYNWDNVNDESHRIPNEIVALHMTCWLVDGWILKSLPAKPSLRCLALHSGASRYRCILQFKACMCIREPSNTSKILLLELNTLVKLQRSASPSSQMTCLETISVRGDQKIAGKIPYGEVSTARMRGCNLSPTNSKQLTQYSSSDLGMHHPVCLEVGFC